MKSAFLELIREVFAYLFTPLRKLSNWIREHPDNCNAWATIVATSLAAMAIGWSAYTYWVTKQHERDAKRDALVRDASYHINNLLKTEGRYKTVSLNPSVAPEVSMAKGAGCTGCGGAGTPVGVQPVVSNATLEFSLEGNGENARPIFGLQERLETRHFPKRVVEHYLVEVDGKEETRTRERILSVSKVVRTQPRLSIEAFGCLGCDSLRRLSDYLALKRLMPEVDEFISPDQYVRLARAATDFGELDAAKSYLTQASDGAKDLDSAVYRAMILEDIGKTYLLLGNTASGDSYLKESKSYWESERLDSQLARLHETIAWQAQFACSRRKHVAAESHLNDLCKVIVGYQLGPSKTSVLIENNYLICLCILASNASDNPHFPIPVEHKTFEDGRWQTTVEVLRRLPAETAPSPPAPVAEDLDDLFGETEI